MLAEWSRAFHKDIIVVIDFKKHTDAQIIADFVIDSTLKSNRKKDIIYIGDLNDNCNK